MRLAYAIKFVADMDKAIAFHRDVLGLKVKMQTPFWSELDTGETTLALHPASPEHPAGAVQLGYSVSDLDGLYGAREAKGLTFTAAPKLEHGTRLARFLDSEQAECSISG
jgi:catechol 2,3-dioxygenase-like lactoylglutathione lyase family enzyme